MWSALAALLFYDGFAHPRRWSYYCYRFNRPLESMAAKHDSPIRLALRVNADDGQIFFFQRLPYSFRKRLNNLWNNGVSERLKT